MNNDVQDISRNITEQRELYRPRNIQEQYLSAMMGDILLIYYAVDEALKKANEFDAKTDKAISDLANALLDSKKALSTDVLETQQQIEAYITKIQTETNASIKNSVDISLGVLEKRIDERISKLLIESEKKIEKDVLAGKKEIAKVLDKVNTNKLFAYALIFALCSSLITGLFVFSISQYFFNKSQEVMSVQADKLKDKVSKPR